MSSPQSVRPKLSLPVRLLLLLVQIGIVVTIGYFAPPLRYWPMWLSGIGWVGFSQYWALAARNSAEAKTRESTRSRSVHEILMNAALLLLFIPVPGLGAAFLPESLAWVTAGLSLQGACLALAVSARRHLGRNWSMRVEIKQEHELVQTGPYRLLRHPIYTAMAGMSLGTALVSGHLHALAGVALVLAAYWRKTRMEESVLREQFGAQYENYRRSTWGVVPGLF